MLERTTKEPPISTATLLQTAKSEFPRFKTFQDPQLEAMVLAASAFVGEFWESHKPRWLSYLGHSGTGKTFLAEMILSSAKGSHLASHPELITGVHKAFWPKTLTLLRGGNYYIIEDLADANFVFIDEIAIEHDPSGFGRDKLCELLSRRVNKWTLITSNLTLEKLAQVDTRISSRMIRGGSVTVEVETMDYFLRQQ